MVLEEDLETRLEDVGIPIINRRRDFTIFDLDPNVIKHKPGFSIEVPVKPGGYIHFSPSPDTPIIQVDVGQP